MNTFKGGRHLEYRALWGSLRAFFNNSLYSRPFSPAGHLFVARPLPSAARDGSVRVTDRDVRPGEDLPGPLRTGLSAAPGGRHGLGPDLHHGLHAV